MEKCVNLRFSAAWIIFFMSLSWHTENIPFNRRIIFTKIDTKLNHIAGVVRQLIFVFQVNLDEDVGENFDEEKIG